jgi:hypothetical protein
MREYEKHKVADDRACDHEVRVVWDEFALARKEFVIVMIKEFMDVFKTSIHRLSAVLSNLRVCGYTGDFLPKSCPNPVVRPWAP